MLNNKDTRVLFIFISYLRLVILLLRAGRHGKILIEKRRRDSDKFGNLCLIQSTCTYKQYSIIADLHNLQFTVTHALGFSHFTSRTLVVELKQSHCD
jgi:hypothetical protein